MNFISRIEKEVSSIEYCINNLKDSKELFPAIECHAKRIEAILEDKSLKRRAPDSHPSREENKNRYKKENIRQEDKPDYKDTVFDPDLRKN